MSKIDLNEFKNCLPFVKKTIHDRLKVHAGTQSAYDIMAASRGFSNYHAAKAQSKYPYFELKSNMGTRENPFFVTIDLGHQIDMGFAQIEAQKALKGCQQFQTWFLYQDGENTHVKYDTAPKPDKGLVYQIEVTGETLGDVDQAIEEVRSRLDNVMGFDRNEVGSFSFQRVGEEYDFTADVLGDVDLEDGPVGIIFDSEGNLHEELEILDSSVDIDDMLTEVADRPEMKDKIVIGGLLVSKEELFNRYQDESDMETYYLFGFKNGQVDIFFKGNVSDIVEDLKFNAGKGFFFRVYEESGMSEPETSEDSFLKVVKEKVVAVNKYALIDDNGVVFSTNDEHKVSETFNYAYDDLYDDWDGVLREAYEITPEQLIEARNNNLTGTFIVVSVDDSGNTIRSYSGAPSVIVEVSLTDAFKSERLMFFKQVRSR